MENHSHEISTKMQTYRGKKKLTPNTNDVSKKVKGKAGLSRI